MVLAKRDKFFVLTSIFFGVLLFLLFLFSLYLFSVKVSNGVLFNRALPLLGFSILAVFIHFQTLIRSTSIYSTSQKARTIVFRNLFALKGKEYSFDELDGYVTGRVVSYGSDLKIWSKVTWIVKEGKMIERIDESYIVNYNELEEEIKELKYLGYQKIRFYKRLKMVFGPISID